MSLNIKGASPEEMERLMVHLLDGQDSLAVEQTAKGDGGFSLPGAFQAEFLQALGGVILVPLPFMTVTPCNL